jgi:hypothetical protein
VCSGGTCGPTCLSPELLCGVDAGTPYCADGQTDNANCGACGKSCGTGQVCSGGACGTNCGGSDTLCPGGGVPYCADLATDGANCGTCGKTCPSGQPCSGGSCKCPTGLSLCGSSCVDETSDHDNCGKCGTVCEGSSTCVNSLCVHYAFVSSKQYPGNLGGLVGADDDCQSLATTAGLPGVYRAWLSDDTNSASARLTHSTQPYMLTDGVTIVALDWTDLTSGILSHAIDITETGGAPPTTNYCMTGVPTVWTDTSKTGTEQTVGANCANWTSSTATSGDWGNATQTGATWTVYCSGSGVNTCNGTWNASLYCLEQ